MKFYSHRERRSACAENEACTDTRDERSALPLCG